MPKPPRARPAGEYDPARPAPGADEPQKPEASSFRVALTSGTLLDFVGATFTDLGARAGEFGALALDRPDRAVLVVAVSAYDAAGSLWDTLSVGLGEAVTDIRKRVFEEGWFGREVTPREVDVSREPLSFEARMGFRELVAMQTALLPHTPETAEQARREPEVSGPDL